MQRFGIVPVLHRVVGRFLLTGDMVAVPLEVQVTTTCPQVPAGILVDQLATVRSLEQQSAPLPVRK